MIKKYKKNNFWIKSICSPDSSIKDVVKNLNKSGLKISLILKKNKLLGTVTDGDIRKALLANKPLESKIVSVMNKNPITVSEKANFNDLLNIMNKNKIDHLPVTNKKKIVTNLFIKDQLKVFKNNLFIIMAGGFGKRLQPYTNKLPKPLLKVKNKEIIKHIIDHASKFNFKNFLIKNFYKKNLIKKFVKKNFNQNFLFIEEKEPLGTAGSLSLIEHQKQDFIVCNSDIITSIDFNEVLNFHKSNNAIATVVLKKIKNKSPYGQVNIEGLKINAFYEKKITEYFAVAGIYVFSPKVLRYLKKNQPLDMITFLKKLKNNKKKIIGFPVHEDWIELGLLENYKMMKNAK